MWSVASFFRRAKPRPRPAPGLLPVLRAGNIQDRLVLDVDLVFVPQKRISERQIIRKGDIVICTSSGSSEIVGKTALATADWEGSFGAFCAGIRPKPSKCEPSFLFHYLKSPAFRSWTKQSAGANIKNIRKSELDLFVVPAPPVPEQRRIASILDKSDRIKRKREQALDAVGNLLKSEFIARFGTPLDNSKCLPTAPIRDFGRVVTGNTPPRKRAENYGAEIEWIKSDNINTPSYFLTPAEERLSARGKRLGRTVPAGSTLITCIAGSPKVIGNAALADREVAFNQQINAVIPNDRTDPFFLNCQFFVAKALIQASSTNSMKGMVSKGKFQEIEFLRPNYDDQVEFGKFFARAVAATRRIAADLRESEKLFGSLAQRAFGGHL